MTRSGVAMSAFRALLPTVTVGRPPPGGMGSSATTDGTRFEPSTPGITTGFSPCIYATRELVVPKSIPTTRPSAILLSSSQGLGNVANQIAEVAPPIQQGHHSLLRGLPDGHISAVPCLPFDAQVLIHSLQKACEFPLRLRQTRFEHSVLVANLARH